MKVLRRPRAWRRELLIAALLLSAGVHAGLAPQHLQDSPLEAAGFGLATGLLIATALLVATRPMRSFPPRAAALLCAALIGAYALAAEPLDVLGLATKAVELVALLLALSLERPEHATPRVRASYTMYVAFGFVLAVQAGHGH